MPKPMGMHWKSVWNSIREGKKIQELDELKRLISIKAVDYSREKVQTNVCHNADFENTIIKIIDIEREINTQIDNFVNKKHQIINQIQGMKNCKYIQVLYKRYVEYKSLKTIANEMDYTYQYTRELHKISLTTFENTYTKLQ